ncbi:M20/M25/M40 family metallo-hydrolase [Merdimmobilis hominis]|uniref:M20/M25/M40 family metallo-hydrolase n=1 Tax=Merdimmobilis hominis TaxID=2897707 RepID=UPI001897706F|nr:M20/M25/M40 family metallo-hydrolase [Merdimmobilis hominis]
MELNKKRLLDTLCEMIRIDSVSLHEKEMADWLEAYFKNRGFDVYRDEAGKNFGSNGGNLLIHVPGTMEGEALCFNAHIDTVSPGNGIEPVVDGEFLVSKGDTILAADDKSGIAAILEAYEYIRENNIPHREMYFLFTICEEQNMMGSKNFDVSKLPCKNMVSIDGAGKPGVIVTAAPAKDGIVATFKGKKAHAGIEPEKGINAITMASKAIAKMTLGRIDAETTANIGRIEGGGQTNVVTDEVFFTAEVRSHSMEKLKNQVESMKKACEEAAAEMGGQVDFAVSHDYPCFVLSQESFAFKACMAAYEKEGIPTSTLIGGGGGDCNIFAGSGITCACIASGMYDVHSSNERLNLEEFYTTTRVVYTMMTEKF